LNKQTAKLELEQQNCQGGETNRLTQEVDALSKALVKDDAQLKHKKVEVTKEKNAAQKLRGEKLAHENEAKAESERLEALEQSHVAMKQTAIQAETNFHVAETTLRGVESGTGAGGDGNKSLQTQLADVTSALGECTTLEKNCAMKTKHLTKELVGARGKVAVMQKQGGKLVEDVAKVRVFPTPNQKTPCFISQLVTVCPYIAIYSSFRRDGYHL